jgi:lysophospholipase L1-like esterase
MQPSRFAAVLERGHCVSRPTVSSDTVSSDTVSGPSTQPSRGRADCVGTRRRLLASSVIFLVTCVAPFALIMLAQPRHAFAQQDASVAPTDRPRILFLGDSNTYAGHYITWLETQLRLLQADPMPELINLGLPSETCSGLSEPDHPFPRPNVHERLDRALAKVKPQVVVIAYGMNDGIYHPFSEERFAAYQRGIRELVQKTRAIDAKLVLLTPPAFDPLPMREAGKLRPADAQQFAWFAIYEDYEQVMDRYAKWIVSAELDVDIIVDIHTPLQRYLAAQRETDPAFRTSDDGVHFDRRGHEVVGRAVLEAVKMTPVEEIPEALWQQVQKRQQLLRDAWLSHVGHQRPGIADGLPLDEARRQAEVLEREIEQQMKTRLP